MANLVVRKEDGQVLFDTDKISYGFVKSGYMTYIGREMRLIKPFINTDPNQASSWIKGTTGDEVYGFSVSNAVSPIVFIVGKGTPSSVTVSGSTTTFLYTNANASTKCYCFDLMSDNLTDGPHLKTYNPDGVLTFNSLQRPLNIVEAITPPNIGPYFTDGYGGNYTCYSGGWNELITDRSAPQAASYQSGYNVSLDPRTEYAAYLPWTRGAGCKYIFDRAGPLQFGVSEGVYGRTGGITFMFGPAQGTQDIAFTFGGGYTAGVRWINIPTDRLPQALVIETKSYPFPFGT